MSAKRMFIYVFGAMLLVMSCATNKDVARYWEKKQKGKEIITVSDKVYNGQFIKAKGGSVWLSEETRREPDKPIFSFSANIRTSEKTTVNLNGKTYPLEPTSDPDYQNYNNLDGKRHYDFEGFFSGDITFKLEMAGKVTAEATFYAPAPMQILSPLPDQNDIHSYEVKTDTEILWKPDPRHKNGIVINIHEITLPENQTGEWPRGKDYLLLTPDDGKLSIQSLLPYIPKNGNHFMITLSRYGYQAVDNGGNKYRFIVSTSENISYRLVL